MRYSKKIVFDRLFNQMERSCVVCQKDFHCDYTCEPFDTEVSSYTLRGKKLSKTACYCPKCWNDAFNDKDGWRKLCSLVRHYKK